MDVSHGGVGVEPGEAAIIGMVFVSGVAEGAMPGAQDAKGIAFGLSAAVLYAAAVIMNKRIRVEDAYEKTIVQLLSAAPVAPLSV